ncbi:MAG: hypothetical protein HY928_17775, partial [Elusimicrobia bacterium]|nr:hypothetical protein [Elusimicrobiota bacterium]
GHPDHMAVHDAVAPEAARRGIPFISAGLPEAVQAMIPLRPEAAGRPRPSVTHKLDLDRELQAVLAEANRAYRSQEPTLRALRLHLGADDFYRRVPRQFFSWR